MTRVPTTIELCAGTGSFSAAVRARMPGHHAVTVDNDPLHSPMHCESVLTWDYETHVPPARHFVTHVWASPPCTQYSNMRTTGPPRDLVGADAVVQKCLEMIQFYQLQSNADLLWFVENPRSSLLKTRPFMANLPSMM